MTGETPVVDVQSVRREFVVNKDMMEALPVGRSLTAQIVLIAGVTGQNTAGGVLPTVHGSSSSETYMYNDGMRAGQHMIGAGIAQGGWAMSEAASSELTYQTGAQSAEFQVGGVAMNAIPKEGGNRFSGTFVGYGAGSGVQSDNRTEELKQVIRDANRLIYTAEIDTAVGGPIVKRQALVLRRHARDPEQELRRRRVLPGRVAGVCRAAQGQRFPPALDDAAHPAKQAARQLSTSIFSTTSTRRWVLVFWAASRAELRRKPRTTSTFRRSTRLRFAGRRRSRAGCCWKAASRRTTCTGGISTTRASDRSMSPIRKRRPAI